LLKSFRALELTDENGALCGKILADLGAEVVKIERPGGDTGRNMPPFYQGVAGPERSLYWSFYNLGKKSLTLNIENIEGQRLLRQLVEKSNFLIESCAPGYLDKLGLGYQALSRINPQIIMTSISSYGQTGPYRDYKADDITLMAMGGLMYVTGDPDRPPLRISIPQAYLLAGAQAAAASMTAHHYRQMTGAGQYVDVSAQNCVMSVLANIIPLWELSKTNLKRVGSFMSGRGAAGVKQRMLFACKDGAISLAVMGGPLLAAKNRAFVKWMDEEGQADDFLRGWNWDEYDLAKATTETQDSLEEYFARFLLTHTKAEIYDAALKRGFMAAPVSEPRDILENPQLEARGYWQKVEQTQLQATLSYPGRFYQTSLVTEKDERRPPLVGEHNIEIFEKELGLSRDEVISLKGAGVI
jgi:crotonobetainyl-CoA:carnitine CoA-transferase CaiB-like acyl-CoA transferase